VRNDPEYVLKQPLFLRAHVAAQFDDPGFTKYVVHVAISSVVGEPLL